MEENIIQLNQLSLGKKGIVKKLDCDGLIRRRLLDLGLIEGTEIQALQISPSGDPVAYLIRGAVIALRIEITSTIWVELK